MASSKLHSKLVDRFSETSTSTVLLNSLEKSATSLDTDREAELSLSFCCVSLLLQYFFENVSQRPLKVLRWKEAENRLDFGVKFIRIMPLQHRVILELMQSTEGLMSF